MYRSTSSVRAVRCAERLSNTESLIARSLEAKLIAATTKTEAIETPSTVARSLDFRLETSEHDSHSSGGVTGDTRRVDTETRFGSEPKLCSSVCFTWWIDAFSAPLTRLGLLSLLALLVLGLSVLAVPGLLSDDGVAPEPTQEAADAALAGQAGNDVELPADRVLLATARVSDTGIVLDGLVALKANVTLWSTLLAVASAPPAWKTSSKLQPG